MATKIYMTEGDDQREITVDLNRNGAGYDLTASSVECHMSPTKASGLPVNVVTAVVPDGDQTTYPGRCATTFAAADLVVGVWSLEWEVTKGSKIITFPGKGESRPQLIVRQEAD